MLLTRAEIQYRCSFYSLHLIQWFIIFTQPNAHDKPEVVYTVSIMLFMNFLNDLHTFIQTEQLHNECLVYRGP